MELPCQGRGHLVPHLYKLPSGSPASGLAAGGAPKPRHHCPQLPTGRPCGKSHNSLSCSRSGGVSQPRLILLYGTLPTQRLLLSSSPQGLCQHHAPGGTPWDSATTWSHGPYGPPAGHSCADHLPPSSLPATTLRPPSCPQVRASSQDHRAPPATPPMQVRCTQQGEGQPCSWG